MSSRDIMISPAQAPAPTKGEHWVDGSGKSFKNPWPSFQDRSFWSMTSFLFSIFTKASDTRPGGDPPAFMKPTWGTPQDSHRIKSTWLGHAAFLLELPSRNRETVSSPASASSPTPNPVSTRGLTFLCDPVFSQRCSPSQKVGPAPRVTQSPATVEELPEIDAIVISHNHYDHCDLPTLGDVYKKQSARPPYLFIPLANGHTLKGTVPDDRVIQMDWWDERIIEVEGKGRARVTCTPCQHMCARTPFDKNHALWSSWAIQGLDEQGQVKGSIWFAGDTGYCSTEHEDHRLDTSLPVCPAFKEIGKRIGPFDLALIPIGAYAPRFQMSPMHNAPIDAVRMFRDVNAKKAVGMHWGTWKMALDPVNEPPSLLVKAREVFGVSKDEFDVTGMGETVSYEVN